MDELARISAPGRRLIASLIVGTLVVALVVTQLRGVPGLAASPKAIPVADPCTSADISSSPTAPQQPGLSTVTLTAARTGCTSAEFRFLVLAPGSTTWVFKTAYTASSTFDWNTTGAKVGVWQIGVWARQGGSGANYQAYAIGTFALGMLYCTAAFITATQSNPQPAASQIDLTATAAGCSSPLYSWWAMYAGTTTWVKTTQYKSGGAQMGDQLHLCCPSGVVRFAVWVRQLGSTKSYDSYAMITRYFTQ